MPDPVALMFLQGMQQLNDQNFMFQFMQAQQQFFDGTIPAGVAQTKAGIAQSIGNAGITTANVRQQVASNHSQVLGKAGVQAVVT